jgi:hypothetical protein
MPYRESEELVDVDEFIQCLVALITIIGAMGHRTLATAV